MEFLELVIPGLNRNNLVYWGTVLFKSNIIDTALLFNPQDNTHHSESDDVNSEVNDDVGDNDNGEVDKELTKDHQLDVENEFLMFMMRLRLGLNITDL